MKLYDSLTEAGADSHLRGCVMSIGNFDGVHLGHRELLKQMQARAEGQGRPSVVVTFFPPAKVFFSGAKYLCTAEEKQALLTEFRPDAIVTVPFTEEFSHTTKQQFMDDLALFEPSVIVVGSDFRFGQGREGGVNDLATIAPVQRVELVSVAGLPVGSTLIRQLLADGRVEDAAKLLGRHYFVRDAVVVGHKRGRLLGYPTANLDLPEQKALPHGVYAVMVDAAGGSFGGMANVGSRPTFPDSPPPLEVHLFDFNLNIYGLHITVHFFSKLRDARRFTSIEELKDQLAKDEKEARKLLPI